MSKIYPDDLLPDGIGRTLREDIRVNAREPKIAFLLILFRLTQWSMRSRTRPRWISAPLVILYRAYSEMLCGVELRPKTRVGAGLTIHHGYGLVVNNAVIVGRGVELRNGVTIGHRTKGGASPTLADNVSVGAGAIILGGIHIGRGVRIGAGSVVLRDVPEGESVAGNPARPLGTSSAKG